MYIEFKSEELKDVTGSETPIIEKDGNLVLADASYSIYDALGHNRYNEFEIKLYELINELGEEEGVILNKEEGWKIEFRIVIEEKAL